MNLTTNNIVIILLLFGFIFFMMNKNNETFVITKKPNKKVVKKVKIIYKTIIDPITKKKKRVRVKVVPVNQVSPIVQTTNLAPVILNNTVASVDNIASIVDNIAPVVNNIVPVVNNIAPVVNNIVPTKYTTSIQPTNIHKVVNSSVSQPASLKPKKEISITKDILKPFGNFIVNTIKNPPAPKHTASEIPKKEISITKDILKPINENIIKPVINVVANEITKSSKPAVLPITGYLPMSSGTPVLHHQMSSEAPVLHHQMSSEAPVVINNQSITEPSPNILPESENLYLLEPITSNGTEFYGTNPDLFKNIDFLPDNEKYLTLNTEKHNEYSFGLPNDFIIDNFTNDLNDFSVISETVSTTDKTSVIKNNNLVITGVDLKNKDLIITGLNQTNVI
jgi:hypothetical protein